ncbi:MAG: efflux RND transporter periplasmic adaptor subunit [Thermodesulfovibrionales bacterium]|nr:efflux RND transporter periplasmic adaptor subunit [Thermodesulfovibrionales bacterium]
MKNRKIRLLITVLVLAGLIFAGIRLWHSSRNRTSGNTLILYGNVDIRQVDLAFNANERIAQVLAEEGDRVEKGTLLATLETDRLVHEVARAGAQVRAQKEFVARLEAGSRQEEIRKARAEVNAAEAEAENAKTNAQRMKSLAEEGAVTIKQRDDANTAAEAAAAHLEAAREVLELALKGPRKEDIASAKATLNASESELAVVQRRLDDASLSAPSDGVIQNRIMEPGDMASPLKPVFTLALVNPVWVRAYVQEPDLGKVKPGMTAEVSTDSFPDKTYKGWVGFVSSTAEFTPKSVETTEVRTKLVYQLRIYVCNPEHELRLGMPATVTIPLGQDTGETTSEQDRCKNP